VSEEDDAWAFGWMADHPQLEECSSARITIDRITHRALNEGPGWRTLCGSHRFAVFADRGVVIVGLPPRRHDFSSASVDCLCCLPAGG
jgi:hypothetical protein